MFPAVAPVQAHDFLGFGFVSGSSMVWEEAGDWLIGIGVEERVFWGFSRGIPVLGQGSL